MTTPTANTDPNSNSRDDVYMSPWYVAPGSKRWFDNRVGANWDHMRDFIDDLPGLRGDLGQDPTNLFEVRSPVRTRVRQLAALWPELPVGEVAGKVTRMLHSTGVFYGDVLVALQENNGGEVTVEQWQQVGRMLSAGETMRTAAAEADVSYASVRRLNRFIDLVDARRSWLRVFCAYHRPDGLSRKKVQHLLGLSESEARQRWTEAGRILKEGI